MFDSIDFVNVFDLGQWELAFFIIDLDLSIAFIVGFVGNALLV